MTSAVAQGSLILPSARARVHLINAGLHGSGTDQHDRVDRTIRTETGLNLNRSVGGAISGRLEAEGNGIQPHSRHSGATRTSSSLALITQSGMALL